jgi:sugar O-acyltransferase (sialic acid O-acetyltransferase NeuD family)
MTIGLIGYGAVGKQVETLLRQSGYNDLIIFDDNVLRDDQTKFPFLHFDSGKFDDVEFLPTIGYKSLGLKTKVFELLHDGVKKIFTFVHRTSFVNDLALLKEGVICYPMCNIDQSVVLHRGVLLNNSCIISHNTQIGENTYVSPGVVISGNVTVGKNCFIGSGTVISNDVNIGNDVIIGVGSCITKDIPNNTNVIGNPLRIVRKLNLV